MASSLNSSYPLKLGTVVKPWGKIGAVLVTCGEPYYMMQGKGGVVSLLPAKMVQHHYERNKRG